MFDKKRFSNTLQKIVTTYTSISEFAEKSEVNRTYLSKYINMKLDNPPTPKILEKIANASNGIVTYKNLMVMCGYLKDEFKNYANLSNELAKSKAYIDCFNLLTSIGLSETETTKILYEICNVDVEKISDDEQKLKDVILSILESFSKDNKELGKIILTQYWNRILEYRKEAITFLNKENYNKDEQEFRFAYHKEMEGLTDEEIADALRFYKEMKKKVKGDK